MPKRKPSGFYTKGKGPDRTVHPTFNPKGIRIPKNRSGTSPVFDSRIRKRKTLEDYKITFYYSKGRQETVKRLSKIVMMP